MKHTYKMYQHKNGRSYTVLGTAVLQTAKPIEDMEELIVYVDMHGSYWARPSYEFFDGRFTEIAKTGIAIDGTDVTVEVTLK